MIPNPSTPEWQSHSGVFFFYPLPIIFCKAYLTFSAKRAILIVQS